MSETRMKYCRRGWKEKVLFLASADEATRTCSLKDEAGVIVVSELPVVEDPSAVPPADLPKSYAVPLASAVSERAPSTVDAEKVAEILGKAKEPATKVTGDDLDRVNVATLQAILEGLAIPAPEGARSKDLKAAIVDAANAAPPAE